MNLVGSQWDFIWQLLRYSLKLTKSSRWPQHTDFFILQCDKVLQATLPDSLLVLSVFSFKDPGKTEVLPIISESGIPCNVLHSLQSTDNTQLQTFEHHPAFTSFNQLHANIFRCLNTLCRDWADPKTCSTYPKPGLVGVQDKGPNPLIVLLTLPCINNFLTTIYHQLLLEIHRWKAKTKGKTHMRIF